MAGGDLQPPAMRGRGEEWKDPWLRYVRQQLSMSNNCYISLKISSFDFCARSVYIWFSITLALTPHFCIIQVFSVMSISD